MFDSVFRNETSAGDVILNTYLFKQMSCKIETDGKSVRFIAVDTDGKPKAFLLRFGNQQLAELFVSDVNRYKEPDSISESELNSLKEKIGSQKTIEKSTPSVSSQTEQKTEGNTTRIVESNEKGNASGNCRSRL